MVGLIVWHASLASRIRSTSRLPSATCITWPRSGWIAATLGAVRLKAAACFLFLAFMLIFVLTDYLRR
jgi:hypothetical protein